MVCFNDGRVCLKVVYSNSYSQLLFRKIVTTNGFLDTVPYFQTNPFDSTYSIICPWSSCYHDQNPKWMCLKPAVFWQPSPAGHLCRQQLHRCPLLKCGQKDDATLGWIQITRVVPAFCRWIIARFRGADYLTNFSRFVSGVLGTTQWVVAIVWSSNAKKIMPG